MRIRTVLAAATVTFVVVGCGDGGTTPESGSLSRAESMAVFSEILGAVFAVQGGSSTALAAPSGGPAFGRLPAPRAATTIDIEIEEAVPCEEGGSILVDGAVEVDVDENETGSYTFAFSQKPSGCVVVTESGPKYEVDGNPGITMSGSFDVVEGEPSGDFAMSFTGGLSWSAVNGGASGSCSIEMDYVLNWETFQGTAEGRICGHDVSQSL